MAENLLFSLDPVLTRLSQTSTNGVVQGRADTSTADRQLSGGLQAFGNAVGGLAEQSKKKQIVQDIRTAENAALRGEELPPVFGIAEDAYYDVVDGNTANKAINDILDFTKGTDAANMISADVPLSNKLASIDATFDGITATATNLMQNATIAASFLEKSNNLKAELKRDANKAEGDKRSMEVISYVQGAIDDTINFARDTDTALEENINVDYINRIGKLAQTINTQADEQEGRLLGFQLLTQNPQMLSETIFIDKLLDGEYSKGISYRQLLAKGLLPQNKDIDAEAFASSYVKYLTAAKAQGVAIEAANVKAYKDKKTKVREQITAAIDGGAPASVATSIALEHGLDAKDVNTFQNVAENYKENRAEQFGGDASYKLVQAIDGQKIQTDDALEVYMFENNISRNDLDRYKALLGVEQTQLKNNRAAFTSSTKEMAAKASSLFTKALGGTSLFDSLGKSQNPTEAQLAKIASSLTGGGKAIDPIELSKSIQALQAVFDTFDKRALRESIAASGADTDVDVNAFASDFNTQIDSMITNLKNGLPALGPNTGPAVPEDSKDTKEKPKARTELDSTAELINDPKAYVQSEYQAMIQVAKDSGTEGEKQRYILDTKEMTETDQQYLKSLEDFGNPEAARGAIQRLVGAVPAVRQALGTLDAGDIIDFVTTGEVSQRPDRELRKPSNLHPIIQDIDNAVGAVIDFFKDKPSTKASIEKNVSFLSIIGAALSPNAAEASTDFVPDATGVTGPEDKPVAVKQSQDEVTKKKISSNFKVEQNNISDEEFNTNFDLIAKTVAFLESENVSTAKQRIDKPKEVSQSFADFTGNLTTGPARGLFQYESFRTGGTNSAQTALNRYNKITGNNITETDFSKLPRDVQVGIFTSDHSERAGSAAALKKVVDAGDDESKLSRALAEYQVVINKSEFTPKQLRIPDNKAKQEAEIVKQAEKIKKSLSKITSLNLITG